MAIDIIPKPSGSRPTADPLFAAGLALHALDAGDRAPAEQLVAEWTRSEIKVSDNPGSWLRYRWLVSTILPATWPASVPPRSSWHAWRPAEEEVRLRGIARFEARLIEPIILADSIELVARLADEEPPHAPARGLLAEALPGARRDLAAALAATHAWTDTWTLWNIVRRPHALRRLHPFAFALADTYAERAIAAGSIGTGSRFPFHRRPLVSVSAQLATGLLALGFHPQLTGRLVADVREGENPAGGWADAAGPVDPLTTLVAADLLVGLDPAWDPTPTIGALRQMASAMGNWTAYGPETQWLTVEIERLVARAAEPFERRFRWPEIATAQRDRRTQLPFLGFLIDLERLFVEIDSLRDASIEMAFLDLAGFGAWNNRFGMAAGDDVLRFLAGELRSIPEAIAMRDGGDEFVIIGPPFGKGLPDRMTSFRTTFPDRFAERFGQHVEPVAPRIVTSTVIGRSLVAGRDQLGRDIARLKERCPEPDRIGVQATSDELAT